MVAGPRMHVWRVHMTTCMTYFRFRCLIGQITSGKLVMYDVLSRDKFCRCQHRLKVHLPAAVVYCFDRSVSSCLPDYQRSIPFQSLLSNHFTFPCSLSLSPYGTTTTNIEYVPTFLTSYQSPSVEGDTTMRQTDVRLIGRDPYQDHLSTCYTCQWTILSHKWLTHSNLEQGLSGPQVL